MTGTPLKLLVTRPKEDAAPLIARLEALGHDVRHEALLIIDDSGAQAPGLSGVQALAFTSANGVRAFARASAERAIPVFAVGAASAREATERGFTRVTASGGDVEKLARTIRMHLNPEEGRILHAAGSTVAGDLQGALGKMGFSAARAVLYEARAAAAMSEATVRALAQEQIDAILFYSPRTARIFKDLIERAGLQDSLNGVTALCLSPAVAEALARLTWRTVLTAQTPHEDAMVALLPRIGAQS